MYLGKSKGFGQRFSPPEPSPYLERLGNLCGDYQRSPVTLSLIRQDIKSNNLNKHATRPKNPLLDEAIRRAFRAFMIPEKQKMLHLNDVFKRDLPIWSSSPGLPWNQLGYKNKGDIRRDPDAVQRIRWFWHRIKAGESLGFPDCCAYVRSHICKTGDAKVRAVWGYPATVTFGEAVFALPLIDAYRKGGSPIAYGLETGNGGCRKLFTNFKGNYFTGIDFSSFDKTLPAWLIEIAFEVLAYNIDFGNYKDYGIARTASMLHMFDRIKEYCIKTRIRMCNGERYLKTAGLASGSYFTQLVGSVCNYILLTYSALRVGVEIQDIVVLGDDSLTGTDLPLTADDVADAIEPLGMCVNVEKSSHSRYVSRLSFLGYTINDGLPSRKQDKTLASLIWPERPDKDWNDVASRALGILYANLGVDPVVDFWCREIVNFRAFDLHLTRDQRRYIALLGMDVKTTEPPTPLEFARRLHVI